MRRKTIKIKDADYEIVETYLVDVICPHCKKVAALENEYVRPIEYKCPNCKKMINIKYVDE